MPNNRNAKTTACNVCGYREARTKYGTRAYGKGADLLVIENVPVVVCPSCGQSQLTAETLHELERIKLHRHGPAKPRSVAVASFIGMPISESQCLLLDERLRQHEENPEDVEPWEKVRNDILSEM